MSCQPIGKTRTYACPDDCGYRCRITMDSAEPMTAHECPRGRGYMYEWREVETPSLTRAQVRHLCRQCRHAEIGRPCERGYNRAYQDCYEPKEDEELENAHTPHLEGGASQ
jgi:hypothetical protein